MTITMRPFAGEADFLALTELIKTVPANTPHTVDLPWRMSSPVTTYGRKEARVQTDSACIPAIQAYEAVGFQIAHKIFRQGKYL